MPRRWLFLLIYTCSGVAGLVYEVAWTRLLGLTIGHSGQAAGTVLGAYMGGMAIGALVAGRLAPAWTRQQACRAYASLEFIVAASAVLLPTGLSAARPLLASMYGEAGGGASFDLTRLAVCLVLMALPTAAMGATFPVAARWFVRRADRPGSEAGALYVANTVGAAAGALAAGFLLLPWLGFRLTTSVAVLLNLGAGAAALWLGRHEVPRTATAPAPPRTPREAPAKSGRRSGRKEAQSGPRPSAIVAQPVLAAVLLALSGACAMAAELGWTRVLALVIGPTSQAFSAMLATFIGGLAIGSAAGTTIGRTTRRPGLWLAASLGAAGLATIGASVVVNHLPLVIAEAARVQTSQASFMLGPTLHAVGWMLPMAVAFGAAFPLGLVLATSDVDTAPRPLALVYASNTAGAIAGALATAFLVLPVVGLERTFLGVAVVAATGSAVAAACRMDRRAKLAAFAVSIVAVAGPLLAPRWDMDLLLGGAYKYARFLAGVDAESALRAGTLLWHAEGRVGTVSVRRTAGVTTIAIDGKVDASNGGDMLTQKLLGHVPLLLHPSPRRVCIIGLGSGVTLGAALSHPIEAADVIELAPEVVQASAFFRTENGNALSDRRARLIVGDGRTHLVLSRQTYDVIISEPSNPWIAGMSALFTREFFEAARGRLAPGGLMCQWAHTYDMREEDLRSILATFTTVFPGAIAWAVGEGDLLLIGGAEAIGVDPDQVIRRWASRAAGPNLAPVGLTRPFSLLSLLAARGEELARYSAGAPIQTDDRLALEYSGPGAIFNVSRTVELTDRLTGLAPAEGWNDAVGAVWRAATASDWCDRGQMLLGAEAPSLAYRSFARALSLSPRDPVALDGLTRAAPSAGEAAHAVALLRGLTESDPGNVAARVRLCRLLAAEGLVEDAEREARRAAADSPENPEALEQWASILADRQDVAALAPLVEQMKARHPGRAGTDYYAGTVEFLQGRFTEAAGLARRAASAEPGDGRSWSLAGSALASAGQLDQAREAFAAALRANPRDPSAYANLGLMAMNLGRPDEAARHFAEALVVDASYAPARQGLADALDRMGASDRAQVVRAGARLR